MSEVSKSAPKYIKNPNRGKPVVPFKPYVPHYKELGITPTDGFTDRPVNLASPTKRLPFAAQVLRKAPEAKQPYAEPGPTFSSTSNLPNVGSDNEWFEDFSVVEGSSNPSLDPEQEMIDNNEIVNYTSTTAPLSYKPTNMQLEYKGKPVNLQMEYESQSNSEPEEVIEVVEKTTTPIADIEPGQYVLMIEGQVLSVGEITEIEAEVSALIFGEHPLFPDQSISSEQIMVLKRIPIKVGVFLE